jgi:2-polyprenyl-3-methyl-5-hydroxy-6-metoxy-1,4-benzoquinol methylase
MISAEITSSVETAAAGGCVVCGARLTGRPHLEVGDFRLFRCPDCATWSSHPRVDVAHQAALHDSAEYFEHEYFKGRREVSARIERRCEDIFGRLSCAVDPRSLGGERLLDVGCDTGGFLESAARQFGIKPVGLDVAARAVRASSAAGIEAYHATIESAPAELRDFRVITAIDVVEHVTDPLGFLRAVKARLAPGGAVYLETPNIRSSVYGVGRMLCGALGGRPRPVFERLFPPQHIQYFTSQSLERLVGKSGLELVRMGRRHLPSADISASAVVRSGVGLMQVADRLTRREILIWAVLRRPAREL